MSLTRATRLTSKGQVTIPIEIRERLGLRPGTRVEFDVDGDAVRVMKASEGQDRGRQIVSRLRGRGDVAMSTDEIMALTRGE
jgi:AbrB family looped-hinge helix DNA binding protein